MVGTYEAVTTELVPLATQEQSYPFLGEKMPGSQCRSVAGDADGAHIDFDGAHQLARMCLRRWHRI